MFAGKDLGMDNYLVGIGKRIKQLRKSGGNTISEIAFKSGVTNGLISRIENGRTIPSVPVLMKIISALQIEVADFFNGIPKANGSKLIVTRKEDNSAVEKEDDAVGFQYSHVFGKQMNSLGFEAVLLVVAPNSKREKVTTDAYEFKFMLSGECIYILDDEEVTIREGDSIFFDGRIPHVPVNRGTEPAKLLVLYFFI